MKKIIVLLSFILITGCSNEELSVVNDISCDEYQELIKEDVIIIDVRTKAEYEINNLENSINLPSTEILDIVEGQIPNKEATIILYCQSGTRSREVANSLVELGYQNVYDYGSIDKCN